MSVTQSERIRLSTLRILENGCGLSWVISKKQKQNLFGKNFEGEMLFV